jgi:hypothetical protein
MPPETTRTIEIGAPPAELARLNELVELVERER